MTERVPLSILTNLVHDEEYARQVVPFIEPDYFEEHTDRVVYEQVAEYLTKYDTIPTKEALQIEVGSRTDLTEDEFQLIEKLVSSLELEEKPNSSWLLDTTEKWCKDRAIYLALIKSIQVADGNDDKLSPDAIPGILSDALAVGFDQHVGHDYIDDSEDRYAYYHRVENASDGRC